MLSPISAKAAFLQILSNEPGYGSDLADKIKKLTGGSIDFGVGSVYPAIRDLEKDGLIIRTASKGRANLYKVTVKGKKIADDNKKAIAVLFGI